MSTAEPLTLPAAAALADAPGAPSRRAAVWLALLLAVASALALLSWWPAGDPGPALRTLLPPARPPAEAGDGAPDAARLAMSDPALLRALTREQAMADNAARAVAGGPNPPAPPFVLPMADASYRAALECLTAAIYYEAATEPVDGQRAVAQVVLNRVRHPLYPHSVCGVVYQGAVGRSGAAASGCQFTFACDGSLLRLPVSALWLRARALAAAALAGQVAAPVGLATHYHADYVVPVWAGALVKSAVIGRHLFYRFPGRNGMPAAFAARYGGVEPALPLPAPGGTGTGWDGGDWAQTGPGGPALATARPVLDRAGRVLLFADAPALAGVHRPDPAPGPGPGPGIASPARATRYPGPVSAPRPGAAAAAPDRWIIGMDGAASAAGPARTDPALRPALPVPEPRRKPHDQIAYQQLD